MPNDLHFHFLKVLIHIQK